MSSNSGIKIDNSRPTGHYAIIFSNGLDPEIAYFDQIHGWTIKDFEGEYFHDKDIHKIGKMIKLEF